MKAQTKPLMTHPFVRNVAIVASGTAAAQAISVAFTPFVTRLYGPEALGLQGAFTAVAGILATVAALSYPIAIVLPRSDAEARALSRLCLRVGVIMSLLAMAAILLLGAKAFALLNIESITTFRFLLPLAMLSSVATAVATQWGIRKKAYGLTAKAGIITALAMGAAKVGVGTVRPAAVTLVLIAILGGLLTALLTFLGLRRLHANTDADESGPEPTPWQTAHTHSDFALLRTPQNLINALSASLPILILSRYFGSAPAGYYSVAASVLAIPVGLIGNSVMQVFYPRVTDAIRAGEDARSLIITTTRTMAMTGALPFGVVLVGGGTLFAFAFGPDWRPAGVYAQWLSVWLFFQYLNKPAVAAIAALRLQGGLLLYEALSTGSKVLALYIGYIVLGSDVAAIALFSVSGAIAYVTLIAWVILRSGRASRYAYASHE